VAAVTFEGVGKTYGDGTRAVTDLNLQARDGEFVVLVGPSGCGKTTALRMAAGLEEITDGEIRIDDRVVNYVDPQDRDIAMVFQNYALYPQMTVAENIAFGLKMRKIPKSERRRRVDDIAGILGLTDLLDRKPGHLSGGQRQRVAMGRAIVREPKAFLMDEPLSNLDAKLRVQMRAEILRIQREVNTTTIYVTHDQVEAMTMGDRVAVMRRGELQQVDEPQRLYDSPTNLFVASFIGSPPMNLIEATIEARNGSIAASFGGQSLEIPESVTTARPSLRKYVGRRVGLGMRPHNLEDASLPLAPTGGRLKGRVQLTEALGSEIVAYVTMPGQPVEHEAVLEGAVYEAEEQAAVADIQVGTREGETTVCASLAPESRAREGEEIELAVDTARLHFFDLETADAINGRV
jgi:multiple sugar transport system ATP-binding protein